MQYLDHKYQSSYTFLQQQTNKTNEALEYDNVTFWYYVESISNYLVVVD